MLTATLVAVAALAAGLALDELIQTFRPRTGRVVPTAPRLAEDVEFLAGRGVVHITRNGYAVSHH